MFELIFIAAEMLWIRMEMKEKEEKKMEKNLRKKNWIEKKKQN